LSALYPTQRQIITVGGRHGHPRRRIPTRQFQLAGIEMQPDHRGSGIGTWLISTLIDEARQGT